VLLREIGGLRAGIGDVAGFGWDTRRGRAIPHDLKVCQSDGAGVTNGQAVAASPNANSSLKHHTRAAGSIG